MESEAHALYMLVSKNPYPFLMFQLYCVLQRSTDLELGRIACGYLETSQQLSTAEAAFFDPPLNQMFRQARHVRYLSLLRSLNVCVQKPIRNFHELHQAKMDLGSISGTGKGLLNLWNGSLFELGLDNSLKSRLN